MSRRLLDISDLPDQAQQQLRDYYDYLRQRYGTGAASAQEEFDPNRYRGAINVPGHDLERRLKALRDEWERDG